MRILPHSRNDGKKTYDMDHPLGKSHITVHQLIKNILAYRYAYVNIMWWRHLRMMLQIKYFQFQNVLHKRVACLNTLRIEVLTLPSKKFQKRIVQMNLKFRSKLRMVSRPETETKWRSTLSSNSNSDEVSRFSRVKAIWAVFCNTKSQLKP